MPITHNPVHVPFGETRKEADRQSSETIVKNVSTEIELKLKFKGLGRVTRARTIFDYRSYASVITQLLDVDALVDCVETQNHANHLNGNKKRERERERFIYGYVCFVHDSR